MESEQLIRPTVFAGGFAVYRALDREVREVADVDLADYLVLSHALLVPAGAPLRLLPGELCLPADLVAARCSRLERIGLVARVRDRNDRRAFSLIPTAEGARRYDLITGALGLRLRALWHSLPESVLEGALNTLALISGMSLQSSVAGQDGRIYTAAHVLQVYAQTCTTAATEFGLTSAQCGIMLSLGDLAPAGLATDGLTAKTGMPRTTSLPTVALLEEGGLVQREEDGVDDEIWTLHLTANGKTTWEALKARLMDALARSTLDLDEESAAAFATVVSLARG